MEIILASASPRRKELMKFAASEFQVYPTDTDESISAGTPPEQAPVVIACRKAEAGQKAFPQDIIIGCDTVVIVDGQILGKPEDEKDAARILSLLSGKTHKVITGCALIKRGKIRTFSQSTDVTFYPLSDQEIKDYIETGEPFDKAGAYGIQEFGSVLVKEISGDYFNVVGLPVAKLKRELTAFIEE